jgi:hypothetical protein
VQHYKGATLCFEEIMGRHGAHCFDDVLRGIERIFNACWLSASQHVSRGWWGILGTVQAGISVRKQCNHCVF